MEEIENNIPKHIAIIMDGNRRWAKAKGLPIKAGHFEGARNIERLVRYANKIGVKYMTVYAFSTENWKRSEDEVKTLMVLLKTYITDYTSRALSENVKIRVIGDRTKLNESLRNSIDKAEEITKDCTGIVFTIGINYGGRDELVHAIKKISNQVKDGLLNVDDIDETTVSNNLYTVGNPDPDLVIRTSGELRTSNFLPWQIVYSEFYFSDVYWPDFHEKELDEAIENFKNRKRNFGGTAKK